MVYICEKTEELVLSGDAMQSLGMLNGDINDSATSAAFVRLTSTTTLPGSGAEPTPSGGSSGQIGSGAVPLPSGGSSCHTGWSGQYEDGVVGT